MIKKALRILFLVIFGCLVEVEKRMERRRPTISDVARLAGVSASTVSVVLHNSGKKVSSELRSRVENAARALSYRPNLVARSLKNQSTKVIAFVFPNVASPIMAPMVHVVEGVAAAQGFDTLIAVTEEDSEKERTAVNNIIAKQVDGMIICPVRRDNYDLLRYAASVMPVVLIDRYLEDFSYVITNNRDVSYESVHHLIEHGRRCIALIAMQSFGSNTDGRIEGYRAALQDAGLFQPELMRETDYLGENASIPAVDLLTNHKIDAVYTTSQSIVMAVFMEARKRGIRVPDDLALFTFDDVPWMEAITPTFSTTRQPVSNMARAATEMVLARIHDPGKPPEHVVINSEVIYRQSCGCAVPAPWETASVGPPT